MKSEHYSALRRRLAKLEHLDQRSAKTSEKIKQAAEKRLAEVKAEIARLERTAVVNEEAGDRYQRAVAERATLERVLSR